MMAALALLLAAAAGMPVETQYSKKTLVAHRGASAYAPEHTLAAYQLVFGLQAALILVGAWAYFGSHEKSLTH